MSCMTTKSLLDLAFHAMNADGTLNLYDSFVGIIERWQRKI